MVHVIVEGSASALSGAALAAAYAGPLHFEIFGHDLSIRTLSRPILAALILFGARVALIVERRWLGGAAALARIMAGALITAGVLGWITYLSATCGGADSYGYVSASERMVDGDVVHEEPLAGMLPIPNGIRAACPLGYVPSGRVANASVPAYPLGLPAIMAAASVLVGRTGPYLVAPFFGLVLLIAAFATAMTWYRDRHIALLACAMLAVHPLVFTYAIQPMSDVPAAATLLVAIAALSRLPSAPLAGGIAAAVSLVIRPALAPAAIALAVIPWIVTRQGRHGGQSGEVGTSLRYGVPIAIAVVVQAWTQWYLYGDVFSSGYGAVEGLFSANSVWFNARSYGYWGFLTLGPVWIASAFIGFVISPPATRVVITALTIAVGLPYLFYRPYDHWETLRFLLPILVLITIIAAAGVLHLARRLAGDAAGAVIAALVAVAIAYAWMSWLSRNNVFTMPQHEARHQLVGELVAQTTPPEAVILALQHSGSVRYYAARETLNWDQIPTGSLLPVVRTLQDRGLSVFLLIDSNEEQVMFESRHPDVLRDHLWLPNGQRRNVRMFQAADPRFRGFAVPKFRGSSVPEFAFHPK